MTNAFNYLKQNKIQPWNTYNYTAYAGTCKADPSLGVVGTTGYVALPANDPVSLLNAVLK